MVRGQFLGALIGFLTLQPLEAEVLKPRRILQDQRSGSKWWHVSRAESISAWLLCRFEGEVQTLADGNQPKTLLSASANGRPLLFSATASGASADRVMVYDSLNRHLVEADLATGKARRATKIPKTLPLGGIAWNGGAWVLAGGFDGDEAVQFREPNGLSVVARYTLPAEERLRLKHIGEQGSIAAGPDGLVLVAFDALTRAFVLDRRGGELLSLEIPIPENLRVSDRSRVAPPRTAEEFERLWAGRTAPTGVGWTGGEPSVLLASDDPRALTWLLFSARDGRLTASYLLDVTLEPRGGFRAAASTNQDGTSLMVLKTWSGRVSGSEAALFEFFIPK